MPLIYITGPSGAGKSTICNELIRRGYEAYDADTNGLSVWYDNKTHTPVEFPKPKDRSSDWFDNHTFRLSSDRINQLAKRAKSQPIFLCGIPSNDGDFRTLYDKVICLVIDKDTMTQRVTTRTTNNFGKSTDELNLMLYWHGRVLARYKEWGAIMIDAHRPLSAVVDSIVSQI